MGLLAEITVTAESCFFLVFTGTFMIVPHCMRTDWKRSSMSATCDLSLRAFNKDVLTKTVLYFYRGTDKSSGTENTLTLFTSVDETLVMYQVLS